MKKNQNIWIHREGGRNISSTTSLEACHHIHVIMHIHVWPNIDVLLGQPQVKMVNITREFVQVHVCQAVARSWVRSRSWYRVMRDNPWPESRILHLSGGNQQSTLRDTSASRRLSLLPENPSGSFIGRVHSHIQWVTLVTMWQISGRRWSEQKEGVKNRRKKTH